MRETVLFLSTAFILTSGAALGQEKATPQQAALFLGKAYYEEGRFEDAADDATVEVDVLVQV